MPAPLATITTPTTSGYLSLVVNGLSLEPSLTITASFEELLLSLVFSSLLPEVLVELLSLYAIFFSISPSRVIVTFTLPTPLTLLNVSSILFSKLVLYSLEDNSFEVSFLSLLPEDENKEENNIKQSPITRSIISKDLFLSSPLIKLLMIPLSLSLSITLHFLS